ncbi:MAG: hypothetical protein L7V86_24070 [Verrucomicrobiales bacterium]|nr:hypothetical protein [Verrucomicrobiales bacterium]
MNRLVNDVLIHSVNPLSLDPDLVLSSKSFLSWKPDNGTTFGLELGARRY